MKERAFAASLFFLSKDDSMMHKMSSSKVFRPHYCSIQPHRYFNDLESRAARESNFWHFESLLASWQRCPSEHENASLLRSTMQ